MASDPELLAMNTIKRVLEGLDAKAVERVVAWANSRFVESEINRESLLPRANIPDNLLTENAPQ